MQFFFLHAFSAVFFVLISKKCFLDKLSFPKALFLILLSPSVTQCISALLFDNIMPLIFITKGKLIKVSVIVFGTQFDEAPARCMLAIIDEDRDYVLHE